MRLAGCSVDDLDAQRAFSDKHQLGYPLIADTDADIARAYGAYREDWKVATRATAVIGEDGTVLLSYPDAPGHGRGHAEAVFADVQRLMT